VNVLILECIVRVMYLCTSYSSGPLGAKSEARLSSSWMISCINDDDDDDDDGGGGDNISDNSNYTVVYYCLYTGMSCEDWLLVLGISQGCGK